MNNKVLVELSLGQMALRESNLLVLIKNRLPILDIYFLPSHNHQTFYMQVYRGESEWTILYAKPLVTSGTGEQISMWTFADAHAASKHGARKGDVYCGMKQLSLDNAVISTIASDLSQLTERIILNQTMIDGATILIRSLRGIGDDLLPDSVKLMTEERAKHFETLCYSIEGMIC